MKQKTNDKINKTDSRKKNTIAENIKTAYETN